MTQSTSSLIGANFKGMAGLSAFGRLYRLSRLNSLTLRQAASTIGMPNSVLAHLHQSESFQWSKAEAWAAQLGGPTTDRHDIQDFSPYHTGTPLQLDGKIRGCPSCLRSGFHSAIHQLPWVARCPWHDESLVHRCTCGSLLLRGSRESSHVLLQCSCGHDHFDRMAALTSLIAWPEEQVIRATESYRFVRFNGPSRIRLVSDGELAIDQAIAATYHSLVPMEYLMHWQVTAGPGQINDDVYRRIIKSWARLIRAHRRYSLPLLPSETETLLAAKRELIGQIRSLGDGGRVALNDVFGGGVYYWKHEDDEPRQIGAEAMSHRDFEIGSELLRQFVDERAPKTVSYHCWAGRVADSVASCDDRLRLLAHILSAITAQAQLEQWHFAAWRSFSRELGRFRPSYGHPVVLLEESTSSASVMRVLSIPKFIEPGPERVGSYRCPTTRRQGRHSSHYWAN